MSKILNVILLLLAVSATDVFAQTVSKPLGAGVFAPDFTLMDQNGRKVSLSDSKGKSPVLLVFYRGYW